MSKKKIGQENREARNTFVYIEFDFDCKLCCCFFVFCLYVLQNIKMGPGYEYDY